MWPRWQGEWKRQSEIPSCTHSFLSMTLQLCNFRHTSYISGLNHKSAWRVWLELSCCLQVEKGSPAPPVTLVSITTTRPPAPHAHPGPIRMGWNVPRTLLTYIFYINMRISFTYLCSLCSFHSVWSVSSRNWAHLGLRVQMVEYSSCKHEDLLFQCWQLQMWWYEWWVYLASHKCPVVISPSLSFYDHSGSECLY